MRVAAEPAHADGWRYVRQRRDSLLAKSDRYMLPDFPISDEKRAEWVAYRAALRDITNVPHPNHITWPQEPS
jgi:hypothetical protein